MISIYVTLISLQQLVNDNIYTVVTELYHNVIFYDFTDKDGMNPFESSQQLTSTKKTLATFLITLGPNSTLSL